MHIQQTGSGLVWLKEGFCQDPVFFGLWFFTGLPELLLPREASTIPATNTPMEQRELWPQQKNSFHKGIKWVHLSNRKTHKNGLAYVMKVTTTQIFVIYGTIFHRNGCWTIHSLRPCKLPCMALSAGRWQTKAFSWVDTSHPSPLPAFKKKYFSSSEQWDPTVSEEGIPLQGTHAHYFQSMLPRFFKQVVPGTILCQSLAALCNRVI